MWIKLNDSYGLYREVARAIHELVWAVEPLKWFVPKGARDLRGHTRELEA